jgi:hypothetical protein
VVEDIFTKLIHPLQGDEMLLVEIDQQGFETRTILRQLGYPSRKLGLGDFATIRAALDFRLMFGHDQPQRRQFIFRSLCHPLDRRIFQRSLKVGTALDAMLLNPIRVGGHLQPMTGMPRLGVAFLTDRLAQTALAGGLFNPSLESGLPELLLFFASRSSRARILAAWRAIICNKLLISETTASSPWPMATRISSSVGKRKASMPLF